MPPGDDVAGTASVDAGVRVRSSSAGHQRNAPDRLRIAGRHYWSSPSVGVHALPGGALTRRRRIQVAGAVTRLAAPPRSESPARGSRVALGRLSPRHRDLVAPAAGRESTVGRRGGLPSPSRRPGRAAHDRRAAVNPSRQVTLIGSRSKAPPRHSATGSRSRFAAPASATAPSRHHPIRTKESTIRRARIVVGCSRQDFIVL